MRREYIIAGLIFLSLVGIAAGWRFERKGPIGHGLQMNVTYSENWKAGEERDCNSEMVGGDLMLACAMYPGEMVHSRVWDVTLQGRVTNKEINWTCRHDGTSIVCRPSD
jgi:hypothetical protein